MPQRPPITNDEESAIRAAISAAAAGTLPGRFVVIAETIDEDGQPMIEDFQPDEQTIWDTLMLVEFHRAALQGHIARMYCEE